MNMRKAAERLFVSQPALSQRLQNMEKDWGTKIFLRSQKGLSLTPAGELIVKLAARRSSKRRIRPGKDSCPRIGGAWDPENRMCIDCGTKLASESP